MQYRRVYIEGGCYFFTLALADRKSDLLVQELIVCAQLSKG